ncbi:CHRD domain-containing protein [Micromonospora sp. WMMA1363]|uniref:CHRD domain-containing protein n=1 Tax=Micromonospora sp. WMMA1363 TaxID=3053985 RepID=UPI00259C795F|nr:CHRD domain-containing protein [Micromonospora sp. WMMA1363]MDM4722651.1 CHRD domain-containing protein [Micromonospora sp. WMMA1363]
MLDGYQANPLTLSTSGSGRFEAQVDEGKKEITYRLSYADLEGKVQQVHIHFGSEHQSGGIIAFLCSGPKGAEGGAPKGGRECPETSATFEGTIRPGDVVGPEGQGIKPGEFDEVVDAVRAGVTYVDVKTDKYQVGEIRGQILTDEETDREGRGEVGLGELGRPEGRGEVGLGELGRPEGRGEVGLGELGRPEGRGEVGLGELGRPEGRGEVGLGELGRPEGRGEVGLGELGRPEGRGEVGLGEDLGARDGRDRDWGAGQGAR